MLPGKFVSVVVDFESTQELLNRVKEGYLKASWKDGEGLKTGYVVVSSGKIVGAMVEDIITGETLEGEEALREISRIAGTKKVRVVELYEATVSDILAEKPDIRVESAVLSEEIPGWDLEGLLRLLTSYTGELRVHNGGTSWRLYVERGIVKAARTIKGPLLTGNEAMKNLLLEMGHVMKTGRYETGEGWEFTKEDEVAGGHVFTEGVNLLKEKKQFERELGEQR
ncbi:DUF2226 domain-containing protein [Thermococcus sp.]|uniref:DUF2226 domain-containing protein n=1 Tax=Thermococcus sp. TaxID=35749 RepID=UPI0026236BF4|nr:DUF2226 domain-containing protein [Thermococcus sp.]